MPKNVEDYRGMPRDAERPGSHDKSKVLTKQRERETQKNVNIPLGGKLANADRDGNRGRLTS